ncbi:uncharacterized protein LOC125189695 [Salvia hispanica]|uniref:uncharacterized protein LOC125189695 n=1 Tax=Salvia hispanica TaxID=49212 RepID=UPI0020096B2B|nr:uncharacterized protein LOC125189695 [Salvia hispanica]
MRSATDLAEAGIQCVKGRSSQLDQISFDGGKLTLPSILVDSSTKTIYLNMRAFEWFHVNRCVNEKDKDKDNYKEGFHVIAYVFFMDRLIDTAKDVSLLHKHHIMQYTLGSDQSVADIFNTFSTDMSLDPDNELLKVQKRVAEYYRNPVSGCIAYAKRNYFANTWVTLSIFAAIFLFALTISQTLYAVLDYHKSDAPPPPPDFHKP